MFQDPPVGSDRTSLLDRDLGVKEGEGGGNFLSLNKGSAKKKKKGPGHEVRRSSGKKWVGA